MSVPRWSRGALTVPVLIALVTIAAFLPALQAGFVTWDDNRNFLDNAAWRGLGGSQLEWMWTTFHMGHYVPLTWMTLGLDYELGGMNPAGYHLQSVLLHAINAVLVYALALKLLQLARRGGEEVDRNSLLFPAAVGALLFSVHPLRVESVAWITERRDVLSMLFMLISTLSYITHVERGRGFTRWYALAIASFVCALLSKATAMSLPAALLVVNVYPLRRVGGHAGFTSHSARRVYVELVPFGLLAAAIAALSVVALDPPAQLSFGAKLAVSAYSLAFYVVKTIAPANLAPLYEMPRHVDPVALRYVFSYLAVAGLTTVAWIARRRYPGVAAAWFAFLVIVLPMLGIVQNGPQIAADRYTYHAAPALAILAGGALVGWRRPPPLVGALIASVLIGCLGVLTWRQTGIWQDSERLWSRVLAVDPNSSVAEIAMGDLMIARDRVDEAVQHYGRGVELDPKFAGGFNNLGVALARQGRPADAIVRYQQALALNPAFSDAHNNWGIALSQQGDFPAAAEHFRASLALDSTDADAEVNLGNAIVRQGQPADAVAHYARAATIRPDHPETHLNWGVALAQLGKWGDAIEQFRRVLALRPNHAEARDYLDRAERMQPSTPPARRD